MSDDDANFNETLRKDLILRVQKNQDFLESLFELVLRPTKEFSKSLFRKKAINANSESLSNIVNLANLAVEEGIRKWPLQF
jgi:alkylhydroperoxidase/carboxymuconolactone decarboxylase family protein YurZ